MCVNTFHRRALCRISRPPTLRCVCVCVLSWHAAVDQPLKIFHLLSTSPHNKTQNISSGLHIDVMWKRDVGMSRQVWLVSNKEAYTWCSSWAQSPGDNHGKKAGELRWGKKAGKIIGKTEVSGCFYSLCTVIGRITNKLLLGFRQKLLFLGLSTTEDASKH